MTLSVESGRRHPTCRDLQDDPRQGAGGGGVNLNTYQKRAFATARIDWKDPAKRHIPAFGAIGELGSLVSELKKSLRDGKAYTEGRENLVEEFGDVLWYLSALSSHYGFKFQNLIAETKPLKLEKGPFGHIYAMVRTIPLLTEEFEIPPSRANRHPEAEAWKKYRFCRPGYAAGAENSWPSSLHCAFNERQKNSEHVWARSMPGRPSVRQPRCAGVRTATTQAPYPAS